MATAHTVYKMVAEDTAELDERNELILRELPQVHYIAARMHERLPNQVEFADLVQAGVIGLISAYRAFDPTKNAQFSTFAKFRIRGAILDSLRALDWGSRDIRRKARDLSEAALKLQGLLGRHPTKEEIAAEMGLTLAHLNEMQTELDSLYVLGQVNSSPESSQAHDLVESAASTWDNPFQMYCKAEEKQRLAIAVAELPEREQLILSLYYAEELTMKEVGQVVGLAASRVSQIHAATLLKLKQSLGPSEAESVRPAAVRKAG